MNHKDRLLPHALICECDVCGQAALPGRPEHCQPPAAVAPVDHFPGNRKEYPLFTGLLMYFPDAFAQVARCSYIANEQHNPGEPMHWNQAKSVGEGNEVLRHMVDGATCPLDTDNVYHYAKAIWRMAELLQRQINADRERVAGRVHIMNVLGRRDANDEMRVCCPGCGVFAGQKHAPGCNKF